MALSISIVTKCEPCMEWHLDQAIQTGATDEQIYETIDVAIEMGGGQAGPIRDLSSNPWNISRAKDRNKKIDHHDDQGSCKRRFRFDLADLS